MHPSALPILTTEAALDDLSEPAVTVPVVGNVVAIYGVDEGGRTKVLSVAEMNRRGKTLDEVHAEAMANLLRMEDSLRESVERKRFDIAGAGSVYALEGHKASLQLLFVDQWHSWSADFSGDLIACFVGQHYIVFADAGDAASLHSFLEIRREVSANEPFDTSDVLRLESDGWGLWTDPNGSPSR